MVGCSQSSEQVVELKRFPVDSLEGIPTQSVVQIDQQISSEGNGSLRITATKPTVIQLYEVGDREIDPPSFQTGAWQPLGMRQMKPNDSFCRLEKW